MLTGPVITSIGPDPHTFAFEELVLHEASTVSKVAVTSPTVSARSSLQDESEETQPPKDPVFEATAAQTLRGHQYMIATVAFSPDGQQIASGSHDRTIKLWDASSATDIQRHRTLKGHTEMIHAVAFSPDNRLLVSLSPGTIILWDTTSYQPLHTLDLGQRTPRDAAFSPNCMILAVAMSDQTIRMWDAATLSTWVDFHHARLLQGHSGAVHSLAFSTDGRLLASGDNKGELRLWDGVLGDRLHNVQGHETYVHAVAFSPDSSLLASCCGYGMIKLWKCQSLPKNEHLSRPGRPRKYTTVLKLCEIQFNLPKQDTRKVSRAVNDVAFSPDGKLLASCGENMKVNIWDVSSGDMIQALCGHDAYVWGLSFSPDGRTLASCGQDSAVRLWERLDNDFQTIEHGEHDEYLDQ